MLTEEEKQKIQLEESYRKEVQKNLSGDKKSGIFIFLNSNFGAFILSTVIVGGISFVYNQHRDKIKEQQTAILAEQQRLHYQGELRKELIHRIRVIESINDTLYDFQFADFQLAYWGSTIANDPKIKAQYFNFKSFNDEFEKWTLIRLVDELYLVEDDSTQLLVKDLREALNINYHNIKFLGEQWQNITASGKLLGKGRLDLRKGLYVKRNSKDIQIARADLPLKRVWINENTDGTEQLLKAIEKAKRSLSIYKQHFDD